MGRVSESRSLWMCENSHTWVFLMPALGTSDQLRNPQRSTVPATKLISAGSSQALKILATFACHSASQDKSYTRYARASSTNMAYNIPTKDTPKPPGQIRPYPAPTFSGKVEFTVPKTGEKTTTIYRVWGNLTPESTPLVCFHGGPGMLHSKSNVGR